MYLKALLVLILVTILPGCATTKNSSALQQYPDPIISCWGVQQLLCGPEKPGEAKAARAYRHQFAQVLGLPGGVSWERIFSREAEVLVEQLKQSEELPSGTSANEAYCSSLSGYSFIKYLSETEARKACNELISNEAKEYGLGSNAEFKDVVLAVKRKEEQNFRNQFMVPDETPLDIVIWRMYKLKEGLR